MDFLQRFKRLWQEGRFLFDVPLFELSGTTITLATLFSFFVIMAATFWLSRLAQGGVLRVFARGERADEGTTAIVSRLARYTVLVVGATVAIHNLGIDLTGLFAAGALFAVAIGFAMQNLGQNFVSGLLLLLERAIKPGDVLEVEGRLVKVKDMGIRATVARTLDEEDVIIPNSSLVIASVKNYTFGDSLYRLRTLVGVTYSSDMKLVMGTLEQAARSLEWRAPSPAPRVLMVEFGSSSVDFDVSVWIQDPWRMRQFKSELNQAIWWALKDAGITIAFPQLDLHVQPPLPAFETTASH